MPFFIAHMVFICYNTYTGHHLVIAQLKRWSVYTTMFNVCRNHLSCIYISSTALKTIYCTVYTACFSLIGLVNHKAHGTYTLVQHTAEKAFTMWHHTAIRNCTTHKSHTLLTALSNESGSLTLKQRRNTFASWYASGRTLSYAPVPGTDTQIMYHLRVSRSHIPKI
jgi:hypothetical protein